MTTAELEEGWEIFKAIVMADETECEWEWELAEMLKDARAGRIAHWEG
jgi:hypothetical protein